MVAEIADQVLRPNFANNYQPARHMPRGLFSFLRTPMKRDTLPLPLAVDLPHAAEPTQKLVDLETFRFQGAPVAMLFSSPPCAHYSRPTNNSTKAKHEA